MRVLVKLHRTHRLHTTSKKDLLSQLLGPSKQHTCLRYGRSSLNIVTAPQYSPDHHVS
jgi:hypothetical protein